jgi:hypothetical protein
MKTLRLQETNLQLSATKKTKTFNFPHHTQNLAWSNRIFGASSLPCGRAGRHVTQLSNYSLVFLSTRLKCTANMLGGCGLNLVHDNFYPQCLVNGI